MRGTVPERFWSKVQKSDGCWLWNGRNGPPAARMLIAGRFELAHRVSWRLHFGEIPAGKYVCHHCDNPPCVRPDHLFVGTPRDNMRDMIAKGRAVYPNATKTTCSNGHALTPENVLPRVGRGGRMWRQCRPCMREAARRYRESGHWAEWASRSTKLRLLA
jgi:hypothetical protein